MAVQIMPMVVLDIMQTKVILQTNAGDTHQGGWVSMLILTIRSMKTGATSFSIKGALVTRTEMITMGMAMFKSKAILYLSWF